MDTKNITPLKLAYEYKGNAYTYLWDNVYLFGAAAYPLLGRRFLCSHPKPNSPGVYLASLDGTPVLIRLFNNLEGYAAFLYDHPNIKTILNYAG